MVGANALMIVTAGLVFVKPFLGRADRAADSVHEAPVSLWLGPVVLAGLRPGAGGLQRRAGALVRGARRGVARGRAGGCPRLSLGRLHGAAGPERRHGGSGRLDVSWAGLRVKASLDGAARALGCDSDRGWDEILTGLVRVAWWQTRVIQSGYLRHYIMFTIGFATLAVGGNDGVRGGLVGRRWSRRRWGLPMRPGRCPLIVLAATVAAVMAKSRLVAILSLGVVGFVIALIFLLYGAPDVAMTQFMVETLVVIFVALVLARLPRLTGFARPNRRSVVRDGAIAIALRRRHDGRDAGGDPPAGLPLDLGGISRRRATREGYGRNVVNVILVDFRALDTLGEILVVATAGLGSSRC